ncbi:MAG: WYL domain-containing protein [Clostridia bacterium]|nr:WYL domain-containing protein [Clostridia bacterium]
MPRTQGQKLKLLYIEKMLSQESDEGHPISTKRLIEMLGAQGISCERKAIYDDIEALRQFGHDIEKIDGKYGGYSLISRKFELPELKLLVDAVHSSKFITKKKSDGLITKLASLVSRHEAVELKRDIYTERTKSDNEKVFLNVDAIHSAIQNDRRISFLYFEWQRDKKKHYRRNGQRYEVSPSSLLWDDENYYLIAFDHNSGQRRHYRVDKMDSICTEELAREGLELIGEFNADEYSKSVFGMFGGEQRSVTLLCENSMAGVIFDRFGISIPVRYTDSEHFEVTVKITVSPQFYAWVFGLGGAVRITGPDDVAAKMKEHAAKFC